MPGHATYTTQAMAFIDTQCNKPMYCMLNLCKSILNYGKPLGAEHLPAYSNSISSI
uniref:Uncharacterized protein n=1 Tax=Anguilla anguilla TaxID=7936 RepID=A0A0E9UXV5_ANGAN